MNRLSYRSAATLGIVCLGVRAFFAAYIDSPELLGAGWLGVLAGGAFPCPPWQPCTPSRAYIRTRSRKKPSPPAWARQPPKLRWRY